MKFDFEIDKKDNQIIVFAVSSKKYQISLQNIVAESSDAFKRICYISMNKPLDSLVKGFKSIGVDIGKFIFIDCVKKSKASKGVQALHVSSPKALTELGININKALVRKADCIIFDHLSSLLTYQDDLTALKFAHLLISKSRMLDKKCIFICMEEDMKGKFLKSVIMFVDKIIYMH
ncbi:MAG: hypothetical protein V3U72_00930 [Candidatus Aenigmarchaeota archaeon]